MSTIKIKYGVEVNEDLFNVLDYDAKAALNRLDENDLVRDALKKAKPADYLALSNTTLTFPMQVVAAAYPEKKDRLLQFSDNGQEYAVVFWSSDYDYDLLMRLEKVQGFSYAYNVIKRLDAGYTEFEMKNYGYLATELWTPEQLSGITVKATHFKALCAVFSIYDDDTMTHLTVDDIERAVNAGFTKSAQYKEYARTLGVIVHHADKIGYVTQCRELLEIDELKKVIDIHQGVPELYELEEISGLLKDGYSLAQYEAMFKLRNATNEEAFKRRNSPSASIRRILNAGNTPATVAHGIQHGKALAEIA